MLSLAGLLALTYLALAVGKARPRMNALTYGIVAFIALAQAGFLLYQAFTMAKPGP